MHASSHNWGVCVYIIHKQVSCTYITDMKFVLNWYKHICQWLTWPQEPGLTLKNPPTRRISKKIKILTPYHNYWSVFLTAEKKRVDSHRQKITRRQISILSYDNHLHKKARLSPWQCKKGGIIIHSRSLKVGRFTSVSNSNCLGYDRWHSWLRWKGTRWLHDGDCTSQICSISECLSQSHGSQIPFRG